MKTMILDPKTNRRTSAKLSFFLLWKKSCYLLLTAIMALITLTACSGLDDPENEDDPENGNNSGVAGKRIKSYVVTTASGIDGPVRWEFSYNSDGSAKQLDLYDKSSKRVIYTTYANNPDGTISKAEQIDNTYSNSKWVYDHSYNADKTLKKIQGTCYMGEALVGTNSTDFSYQNGKIILVDLKNGLILVQTTFEYDSNGRIATSISKHGTGGTYKNTFSYNTDGTLQKVTYQAGQDIISVAYTWENGKTTADAVFHLLY